ncbi:hypothetical protein A7C91_07860 [Thermococcus piezophilus]|uniref:DUF86 domain-containing protein n=2 Tax=Thermococcus piezophilus TaxID=1712654 RepID=A0A172WJM6_9EURY|nr:hypothetical protein A7C91_07860 [Thermococcus piezophilus]
MVESIELIKETMPNSFEEFQALGLAKDGIYKRLEFAIQCILDICSQIAHEQEMVSFGYKDLVNNLAENGIISSELKEKLFFLVDLREILIYNYDLMSDEIAFRNVPEYIEYIEAFLKEAPWRRDLIRTR